MVTAMQKKAAVFFEASIGLDPESPMCWSGSAKFLLDTMRQANRLDQTFSLGLPGSKKAWLMAKNLSRDRTAWRAEYYFDPAYRAAVTTKARDTHYAGEVCLQIGAMFSSPSAFPDKACLSLNDGNLVERLNSGFGMANVSRKRIDQAHRYEEQVAQQLTAICTFSEYLRKSFIQNYHVSPDKVFNVGGAVNLTEMPESLPNKDYANQEILFIGSDFVRKGGPQLLEAFSIVKQSLPGAQLHIVGPSQLANLSSGVNFHGRLSKMEPTQKALLESLFRKSSLFVLPSLYEPFGIAPLEAMLYEIPCIATDAWALQEMVTPGVNGFLVERGSVEDLAAKILEMLSDPQLMATMGQNGRRMVAPMYTWPAVVDRIGQVIDKL